MQRYQYEYSQICSIWTEVERLLSEGQADAAFRVISVICEWHSGVLGPLRLEFLEVIKNHPGNFEAKQQALAVLISDGGAVDPFSTEVAWLLRRWLRESGASLLFL
jgi:hypothetical protein